MRLPLKTGHSFLILGKDLGKDFESHIPIQLGVVSPVHFSHPTFAEFFFNPVMRNGCTNQLCSPP